MFTADGSLDSLKPHLKNKFEGVIAMLRDQMQAAKDMMKAQREQILELQRQNDQHKSTGYATWTRCGLR